MYQAENYLLYSLSPSWDCCCDLCFRVHDAEAQRAEVICQRLCFHSVLQLEFLLRTACSCSLSPNHIALWPQEGESQSRSGHHRICVMAQVQGQQLS